MTTAPTSLLANRFIRRFVGLTIDLVFAGAAFAAAYVTIYGYPGIWRVPAIDEKLAGFLAASLASFLITAPYRGSWRYVSTPDLVAIVKGAIAAVVIYTVGAFLLTRGQNVPRSVPVLTFMYLVATMAGARIAYRLLVEQFAQWPRQTNDVARSKRRVLLCGLTDSAEGFIRAARRNSETGFVVVGIIDDSHVNLGRTIQGVKVIGTLDEIGEVLEGLARRRITVDELVVTEISPGRRRLGHIVEAANAVSLKVSRLPEPSEVVELTDNLSIEPRPIELGDLLERPEVTTDIGRMAGMINGRTILATGAGGSIGSELCRQIAELQPSRLILTDNSEFHLYLLDKELRDAYPDLDIVTRLMDVRNRSRVSHVVSDMRPDVIFHAAALKHVPLMEENPLEAIKTNILGTRHVADAALANETATFVMISTDKAVNPTNIMGATKRAAETYCQALDIVSQQTRFKTVRFGNVLGSNGSVVPRFQEQIAAGGPVTVTHPQIVRYFMTIPEAVRLVLNASALAQERSAERGKIMVLDMGKPVRIVDLAERMIQLAGYKPRQDIEIVFTGLRPGEKLFEELFDPSEASEGRTADGYVVASPRIIDRRLVERTLAEIETCLEREDTARGVELLSHIVPEYQRKHAVEGNGGKSQPAVVEP